MVRFCRDAEPIWDEYLKKKNIVKLNKDRYFTGHCGRRGPHADPLRREQKQRQGVENVVGVQGELRRRQQ